MSDGRGLGWQRVTATAHARLHFAAGAGRQPGGLGQHRVPARHRHAGRLADARAGGRGHRPRRARLRRRRGRAHRTPVQALSVGVAARRCIRAAARREPAAADRAGVEDAAGEQGAAGGSLGALSGPPEPAAGLRRGRAARRALRAQAQACARGRQRDPDRRRHAPSKATAPMAARATSTRRSRRCRASATTTRCWGPG